MSDPPLAWTAQTNRTRSAGLSSDFANLERLERAIGGEKQPRVVGLSGSARSPLHRPARPVPDRLTAADRASQPRRHPEPAPGDANAIRRRAACLWAPRRIPVGLAPKPSMRHFCDVALTAPRPSLLPIATPYRSDRNRYRPPSVHTPVACLPAVAATAQMRRSGLSDRIQPGFRPRPSACRRVCIKQDRKKGIAPPLPTARYPGDGRSKRRRSNFVFQQVRVEILSRRPGPRRHQIRNPCRLHRSRPGKPRHKPSFPPPSPRRIPVRPE